MCDMFQTSEEDIWHNAMECYPEKETLIISMFHIDPMLTKEETKTHIERVFNDVIIRFGPWIDHYVWNESPVKFKIAQTNELTYIYGEMVFGDYFDDEWLVTQILFELSMTYQDLYIHLADNGGEFLLIEGAHHLPEWIQPDNSRNRDWINHGRLLLVPEEYYKDRGLKMNEAINFLDRAVYKCFKIEELDNLILSKLKQYPTKSLQGQSEMAIVIPRDIAGILMKNKVLNQALLSYGKEVTIEKNESQIIDELVELKVRTTALAVLFSDFYLKSQNLENPKVDTGRLVTEAVKLYAKSEPGIDSSYIPTDEDIETFNAQGDLLQNKLIRLTRIDKYVPSNINFDDMNEQQQSDGDILSKLEDFFKDTNAGLDGVENGVENGHVDVHGGKIEEIDSDPDTEDEDDNAREYLSNENVDIDEDDFFEFFAKEALKLSDKDLETFRNMKVEDTDTKDEPSVEEDDYESDSEEEQSSENFASGDMGKSLQELLKSLKTEGGIDGPAATLLQSMGISIPKQ